MSAVEQANRDRDVMIKIMVSAYHNMGERSTSALSRRLGRTDNDANRILSRMSEMGFARSTYGTFEVKGEWHLTESGWQQSGAEKPVWMTWAAPQPQERIEA